MIIPFLNIKKFFGYFLDIFILIFFCLKFIYTKKKKMDISEGNLNEQKKLCSHEGVYFKW